MSVAAGEKAQKRIALLAAGMMRRAIEETGGREVFFAGSLDARGMVERVRVCARGTEEAVPAFLDMLAPRDVLIHNHPSGGIEPSRADLEIAAACGNNAHGVYIVDNEVERVYVVVEPFVDKELRKLDPGEMARVFNPAGNLARVVPRFEVRPQQRTMLELVSRAFNHDGIAVIEAPTGVGKTFAYLLPAVYWAARNGERIVISTRTINLQEQIMFKDIPLLKKALKAQFNAVLVKGRSNYVCRQKLARTVSETTLFDDEKMQESIKALAEWAANTQDGSRSDLPFMPSRELWERICAETDMCAGSRCPNTKTCFVTKARREVAKADIIIANHHIVFSDTSLKRELGDFSSLAVLPAYRRVIFDEAHSIEDSATEYFGSETSRLGLLALLNRFQRHEHGLLPFIKTRLIKDRRTADREYRETIIDIVDNRLLPSLAGVREGVRSAFDALRELTAMKCRQIGRDIKWRLTEEALGDHAVREVHAVYVLPLVEEIASCVTQCRTLLELLRRAKPDDDSSEPPFLAETTELDAYRARLEGHGKVLAEMTRPELEPNTVRWIEIDSQNPKYVRAVRCFLDVGQCLADWVYENLKSVVMVSATLSVRQSFDFLFERNGLNRTEPARIETAILDTPFDFSRQAFLGIAMDIASPDDPKFLEESVESIRRILAITHGHALILFTSFYALDYTHKRLEEELRGTGITPLKQGEATRTRLLDRFRSDVSSVLFATDSFWEGIDVAGEALQCVILPKLPFRVPTEPILEARAEAIDRAGGNSFMQYTVPQAVIKFRQGFGRLIRRRSDTGAIIVLDRRIAAKYYGKVFLDSLPGVPVMRGTRAAMYDALERFFAEKDHEQIQN
ncbi:MAG TPA: helicase C-terminal domain-containing protein [Candidatus Hydrogenedentes bacterium]|nr:helicase C-terminal domain-containing protein [Candidatus Hydrogenedentota bacterium]